MKRKFKNREDMPFSLSKIELHIPDDLLLQAEELLATGGLTEVTETEPELWVASAKTTEGKVEVEVLLKKAELRAHTCECGQSAPKVYCVHVVSLLLHLLDQQQKKQQPVKKEPEIKLPKRITLPYLLDLARPKELKQFILDYASEDKQFGLLLKTHFAYLLPKTADHEPIGEALATALKAIKKPGKSMSKNDRKILQKVLDTLMQQAEEALERKHFADVFDTAEAIIQQLSSLLLLTDERTVLQEGIVKALLLMENLTQGKVAPELKEQVWVCCYAEAENQVYYFYELWQPLGKLLVKLAGTKSKRTQLMDLLEEKSRDNYIQKNAKISAGLVHFKIQLFELQHNDAALNRYLKENIKQPEVLRQAIQLALQNEQWLQVEQLCRFAQQDNPEAIDVLDIQAYLLQAAIHLNNKKKVRQLSMDLFLATSDLRYVSVLQSFAKKNWPEWRSELVLAYRNMPGHPEQNQVLASLFAEEKMYNELHQHLAEAQSLNLLMKYDQLLFQQDYTKTKELYQHIVPLYLENYMGRPAAVKVRECLNHLMKIGQDELAESLLHFIKNKYSDRSSLLEKLNDV